MSADAQETPFSYSRPAQPGGAPGWKHSAPLGHVGINSSMPSTVGSPPWRPLPTKKGLRGHSHQWLHWRMVRETPEHHLALPKQKLQPEPQRNKRLIYFQFKGRKYLI